MMVQRTNWTTPTGCEWPGACVRSASAGKLTLKVYTKGERVLRFEAIVHNTDQLRCGRRLDRFPRIVVRLHQMLEGFLDNLYCMDACWVSDETLDQLPKPGRVGQTRVGGVDLHRPRSRAALSSWWSSSADHAATKCPRQPYELLLHWSFSARRYFAQFWPAWANRR